MEEAQDGTDRHFVRFPADMERMPGKRVTHASRWFDSMKKRSRFYAKIAERTKCEAFCLDSELNNVMPFNDEWREVLAAVRGVYHGPVTTCLLFTESLDGHLKRPDCWLRDLDFLSVSDYDSPGTKPGAGVEAMRIGLESRRDFLRGIAEETGMREVGCTSTERTAECLWRWKDNGGYNGQEQADILEAKFTLFEKEPWCLGFMWWNGMSRTIVPNSMTTLRATRASPCAASLRRKSCAVSTHRSAGCDARCVSRMKLLWTST